MKDHISAFLCVTTMCVNYLYWIVLHVYQASASSFSCKSSGLLCRILHCAPCWPSFFPLVLQSNQKKELSMWTWSLIVLFAKHRFLLTLDVVPFVVEEPALPVLCIVRFIRSACRQQSFTKMLEDDAVTLLNSSTVNLLTAKIKGYPARRRLNIQSIVSICIHNSSICIISLGTTSYYPPHPAPRVEMLFLHICTGRVGVPTPAS